MLESTSPKTCALARPATQTIRFTLAAAAALMLLASLGCAGSVAHMSEADAAPARDAERARIIFMRPSSTGFAIQSSVFELAGEDESLVGIVPAKAKVAYDVLPGEHLFMVVGEAADFMSADVEAGQTYYALVTPRMGMLKARFGLRPVSADDHAGGRSTVWFDACKWVVLNPDSQVWADQNANSIEAKRSKYLPAWNDKAERDRPRLTPADAVP